MKKYSFVILFSIIAFLSSITSIKEGNINILIFAVLFFISGWGIAYLEQKNRYEKDLFFKLFTVGFILRFFVVVFIYYILIKAHGHPFIGEIGEKGGRIFGSDDFGYEITGSLIGNSLINHQGIPHFIGRSQPGYYIVIAIFHYISDFIGSYHVILPRLFNSLFGSLIPIYIFKISTVIFENTKIARTAAWIALIFPNLVYYSSVQLKDIIITFIFVFAVSKILDFFQTGKKVNLFITLISILILSFFRRPYAVCLSGVIFFFGFIIALTKSECCFKKKFMKKKIFIIFIFLLLIYSIVTGELFNIFNPSSLNIYEMIETGNIHSFYQFNRSYVASGSLMLLFFNRMSLPIRVVSFPILMLIMPYPPWWGLSTNNPLKLIDFFNGIFWLSMLPFFIIGFVITIRRKAVSAFLLYSTIVGVLVMNSISFFSVRYRLPIVPFALILSSFGIYCLFKYNWTKIYYIWFHFLMLSAYLIIKYKIISIEYIALFILFILCYFIISIRKKSSFFPSPL